jgi:hypothetical protein
MHGLEVGKFTGMELASFCHQSIAIFRLVDPGSSNIIKYYLGAKVGAKCEPSRRSLPEKEYATAETPTAAFLLLRLYGVILQCNRISSIHQSKRRQSTLSI